MYLGNRLSEVMQATVFFFFFFFLFCFVVCFSRKIGKLVLSFNANPPKDMALHVPFSLYIMGENRGTYIKYLLKYVVLVC